MPPMLSRLIFLFGLLAHAALAQTPAQREDTMGFSSPPVATAVQFMAVTANPYATDAAVDILKGGGTALDAAIGAQMVLNVVEPQSSGIGGGGFLLSYDADTKRVTAYDGRETAPAAARPERFLTPSGEPIAFHDAVVGGRSVGVPGLLAMLFKAHWTQGRLPWSKLFAPAIRLADDGFIVSPRLHALLQADRFLPKDPAARKLYYGADGGAVPVGTRLRNPELADTLRQIAKEGPQAFYRGPIAADIVAAVRGHPRNPGDMTLDDLAAYHAKLRETVCGPYRGYKVCGMPPPSSGGVTVLELLGLLSRYPSPGKGPLDLVAVHRFDEAGRLAYADRARYLADPDFVPVPVDRLLDPAYLAGRAALISDDDSLGQAQPGDIDTTPRRASGASLEHLSTTHISIVDAQGSAVAMTTSIEDVFGSRVMVRGFLLNNELTDFSFRPQQDGRPVANRVEAGKRPLSAMAPTLVFDPKGQLYAVLGSPGGPRIINYVAEALMDLIDWHLPPGEVVAMPHYGSRNGPTELERGTAAEVLAVPLEFLGEVVKPVDMTSGLHLIVRDGDHWVGAADPRREGLPKGE
jgi:gamma-glutamyltranspeptidase / glutathione hydrolase